MMTPDPRLSDRRSRGANMSLSPKKYRNRSSSRKGLLRVRTTVIDEMFTTPLTACAATRVKSGPPLTAVAAFAGAALRPGAAPCWSTRGVSARESAALRMRPVMTRPPTKPAATSVSESISLRTIETLESELLNLNSLADVDSPRPSIADLGHRHGQDAVFEIGGDRADVNRLGQREGAREAAVAALHAMVLLARDLLARTRRARAADDDAALLGVDLDLIAREPG